MKSFINWDVYYLVEYAFSLMLHGDGEPLLFYYEDNYSRFCYVVMKSDISKCTKFLGRLEEKRYFDLETPYGYGGPLTDTGINLISQKKFMELMRQYCLENNIVSQFIRFHPLLMNYEIMTDVIETRYLRDTIYIDTESPEIIIKNMDSKNRNMVRKATKSGVKITRTTIDDYKEFLLMYDETMKINHAEDYYIFSSEYFESLRKMNENVNIFYAVLDGKPISGSIMLFNSKFMHYHLSGTHVDYRQYSPGNLLLYEAACWASEMGIKKFHLGGGMTSNDSLFGFKKQFNKIGRVPFVVGRTIFNQLAYDELISLRKMIDDRFISDNGYMIQYRR